MSERSESDERLGAGPGERDALESWTVPEVPAGFAVRVVAARAAQVAEREGQDRAAVAGAPGEAGRSPAGFGARVGWRWVVVGLAAVGALVLWQAHGRGPALAGSGQVASARARQSLSLAGRGVAVVEPGASVRWTVADGAARVTQTAGNVFYRVEHGGPFEVTTPQGIVRVTGTCFRVEVPTMKTPWQGLAGAAIGAALVVSVYEGRVLFARGDGHTTAVAAGQKVSVGADGRVQTGELTPAVGPGDPTAASSEPSGAAAPSPPSATATRDELLRRDSLQRAEIADLRKRVHTLEQGGGLGNLARDDEDGDKDGHSWLHPSHEDLVRYAGECRVNYDLPRIMGSDPIRLSPAQIKAAGLTAGETEAVNQALRRLQLQFVGRLRALYVEETGDEAGADALGPQGMASELRDKAPRGEEGRVNQAIARERAGLAQPPADLSQTSPVERYLRMLATVGDEAEAAVAGVIGADRARAMHEAQGGWGMRMAQAGCPQKH